LHFLFTFFESFEIQIHELFSYIWLTKKSIFFYQIVTEEILFLIFVSDFFFIIAHCSKLTQEQNAEPDIHKNEDRNNKYYQWERGEQNRNM